MYKTLGLWLINWASEAAVDGSPVFASDFAPWMFRNLSLPLRSPSSNTHPLPATHHDLPLPPLLTICWQNHRLLPCYAIFILTPPPFAGWWNNKNAPTLYNEREPNETWKYKQRYYYYYSYKLILYALLRTLIGQHWC